MRSGNVLFSAVHLLVVSFILGMGLILYLLPFATEYRVDLADLLLHRPQVFARCGIACFSFGLLLLFGFYRLNSKRYYTIKLRDQKVSSSDKLIKLLVLKFYKRLFPNENTPQDIYLNNKGELELILSLKKKEKEQEPFFDQVKQQLSPLLKETLGYDKAITINVL